MTSLPTSAPTKGAAREVISVKGTVSHEELGITDAHNHVWISPVPGAAPDAPVLDQYDLILRELRDYRRAGGCTLLDCQPPGCGRDGSQLRQLSQESGVTLIACTGFHRRKYYAPSYWLWSAAPEKISEFLLSELQEGLVETLETATPIQAGFMKIALEAMWADCPEAALEGASLAALKSEALVEIHTEKGALAEKVCIYLTDRGLLPRQLVLCHMDKRPDPGLHKALASLGVLLEYDTFYRSKYGPAEKLWPLIEDMVGGGFSDRLALATDMADTGLYRSTGSGPGLAGLPREIREQMQVRGFSDEAQEQMLGGNIGRRLAGII